MPHTSLYQHIADQLRDAIRGGRLAPGSQLPTEQELGERYDVSRNTVRLALAQLANEGMISTSPRRGTFVRDRVTLTYHATRWERADQPRTGRVRRLRLRGPAAGTGAQAGLPAPDRAGAGRDRRTAAH